MVDPVEGEKWLQLTDGRLISLHRVAADIAVAEGRAEYVPASRVVANDAGTGFILLDAAGRKAYVAAEEEAKAEAEDRAEAEAVVETKRTARAEARTAAEAEAADEKPPAEKPAADAEPPATIPTPPPPPKAVEVERAPERRPTTEKAGK